MTPYYRIGSALGDVPWYSDAFKFGGTLWLVGVWSRLNPSDPQQIRFYFVAWKSTDKGLTWTQVVDWDPVTGGNTITVKKYGWAVRTLDDGRVLVAYYTENPIGYAPLDLNLSKLTLSYFDCQTETWETVTPADAPSAHPAQTLGQRSLKWVFRGGDGHVYALEKRLVASKNYRLYLYVYTPAGAGSWIVQDTLLTTDSPAPGPGYLIHNEFVAGYGDASRAWMLWLEAHTHQTGPNHLGYFKYRRMAVPGYTLDPISQVPGIDPATIGLRGGIDCTWVQVGDQVWAAYEGILGDHVPSLVVLSGVNTDTAIGSSQQVSIVPDLILEFEIFRDGALVYVFGIGSDYKFADNIHYYLNRQDGGGWSGRTLYHNWTENWDEAVMGGPLPAPTDQPIIYLPRPIFWPNGIGCIANYDNYDSICFVPGGGRPSRSFYRKPFFPPR